MNASEIVLLIFNSILLTNCLNDCRRFGRDLHQHQCELLPESIIGPFYLKNSTLIRQKIDDFRPGIPFRLTLSVTDAKRCEPLSGLWIVIWQADALGYYSGYTKINPTIIADTLVPHLPATDNSTFLRGAQMTDQDGRVQFLTVIPGWYGGRTHHIHLRVIDKNQDLFTTQLYFPDEFSNWLYPIFPYYSEKRLFNSNDFFFNKYEGIHTIIRDIKPVNKKRPTDGFVGQMVIGLNPKAPRLDIYNQAPNEF